MNGKRSHIRHLDLRSKAEPQPPQSPDLSKLDRLQLLRLLEDAIRENESLHQQLAEARRELRDRHMTISDSESLADASMRLAGVFEAAQRAIDLYRENKGVPSEAMPARDSRVREQVEGKSANGGSGLSVVGTDCPPARHQRVQQ